MDFEEWFKKRHTKTGLYEKSLFGGDDSLYLKHEMKKAFEAGQQSKQAEIEGLKKKLKYEKSAYRNIKLQFLNKQDDLDELQGEIEALKNKMQTALNKACMLQNSSGERIYTELKELLK